MHIARFSLNDRIHWGIVEGDEVRAIEGDLYDSPRPGQRLCALSDARLLAPIDAHANKVVAIAANYGDRAGRDGPGIFMKQPGTVIGPDDSIIYPRIGRRIIHEAEVGIVIGKQARHVSVSDALDYVLGYTCVNDVSANELTNNDVGARHEPAVEALRHILPARSRHSNRYRRRQPCVSGAASTTRPKSTAIAPTCSGALPSL